MGTLEFEKVTKKFGNLTAVSEFTQSIGDEFISLVGPSGCGKTTTLRMVAGLELPTAGRILVKGEPIERKKPHERNMSLMFQEFALFPHLTVHENVAFGLKMRNVPKRERDQKVREMLDQVGLEGLGNRKVTQLSGGQRQRVALGRSLIIDPDVLLLDEPLGSLDAELRVRMMGDLRSLHERLQIPFIHVTHNQDEALTMADKIIVMNRGRIEQEGTPEELFQRPVNQFVARFLGKNNLFTGEVTAHEGQRVTIRGELGSFVVDTDRTPPRPGVPCALAIRANLLTPDGEVGCENTLTCTIKQVEYQGSRLTMLLEAANGQDVKFEIRGRGVYGRSYRTGDRLDIHWRAADSVLLPN